MNNKEIRVKVNGGYLLAGVNPDPDYAGIYVTFETDEGDLVDIVLTECKSKNNNVIDVYCYEDVYTEDWTSKFKLSIPEINRAINGI